MNEPQAAWIRAAVVAFGILPTGATVEAQAPQPSGAADGRVHVSLALSHPPSSAYPPSLEPQAVEVAYAPDLSADAPQHRELLAGAAGSRVRVGTLECHRALRLGEIAPEGGDAARSFEL